MLTCFFYFLGNEMASGRPQRNMCRETDALCWQECVIPCWCRELSLASGRRCSHCNSRWRSCTIDRCSVALAPRSRFRITPRSRSAWYARVDSAGHGSSAGTQASRARVPYPQVAVGMPVAVKLWPHGCSPVTDSSVSLRLRIRG